MNRLFFFSMLVVTSQVCISDTWASGAGFRIFGEEVEQGKDDGAYMANVTVGQSLEILARGWAYPRSPDPEVRKGAPTRADAGTWMFDDQKFRLLKTLSDESGYTITLKPAEAGEYRIRFVGAVLGYNKVCEILVNVSEPEEQVRATQREGGPGVPSQEFGERDWDEHPPTTEFEELAFIFESFHESRFRAVLKTALELYDGEGRVVAQHEPGHPLPQ